MRQIKFKIFSKPHKQFVYDVGICGRAFLEEFKYIPAAQQPCNGLNQGLAYMAEHSDLELCQFTGLKDKNGKEIYEGDILAMGDNFPCLVKYQVSGNGSGSGTGFYLDEPGYDYGSRTHGLWYQVGVLPEVIGNIYMNPELLAKQPEPCLTN